MRLLAVRGLHVLTGGPPAGTRMSSRAGLRYREPAHPSAVRTTFYPMQLVASHAERSALLPGYGPQLNDFPRLGAVHEYLRRRKLGVVQ